MEIDNFNTPTAEYRGKPFWSWNGKLEKAELIRQVHIMKEMGFGGFFMHSRTGLQTEYLSDEWFEYINACADEAEKIGMEAWLYDEDRWPSGTAGGMVTKEPKYRMKCLILNRTTADAFIYDDSYIAIFTAKTDGVNLLSYKRLHNMKDINSDTEILYFTVEETKSASFYNGYTYLDTLNREATDAFIKSTHEKYKDKCGDRLGKSIKGIFTDEPNRGDAMCNFQSRLEKDNNNIAWTGTLFDEFQAKYGYDIIERLPELFLRLNSEAVHAVKWQYIELLQELFINNFLKPINDWCITNNIILTGHVLHENTLANQTAVFGSVMRAYEYMGIPGIDMLCEHDNSYWVAKQISSVTRQLDTKWALSELYGCVGWQMDFAGHKAVGDWQALFGINLRCPHLSWYTMEGEAKRDCPGSILHQSAWYPEYKHIEDYFSRLSYVLSKGKAVCDVVVINPIESVWSQLYPGWSNSLSAKDEAIKELEAKYAELFITLAGAGIDFDYADEDILSRHFGVDKGTLKIGNASYKTVIVSGCTTLRKTTVAILEQFRAAGGTVIFISEAPKYVDCLPTNTLELMAEKSIEIEFDKNAVINCLSQYAVKLATVAGGCNDIFTQTRQDGNDLYFAFLNINRKEKFDAVKITVRGNGQVQLWNCRNGEKYTLGETSNGEFTFEYDFVEAGELIVAILDKKDLQKTLPLFRKACYNANEKIKIEQEFSYSLSEQNVCVLDYASLSINNEGYQNAEEILRIDEQLHDMFGLEQRGGEMIQPWYKTNVLKTPIESFAKIDLSFEFYVDEIKTDALTLVLEHPEQFDATVNNAALELNEIKGFYWIDTCFKGIVLPASILKSGKNTVTLHTSFSEISNLEAIYILGNFGVSLEENKKTLTLPKDKLTTKDLSTQGLPFYSGKIIYEVNCNYTPKVNQQCILDFSYDGACMKLLNAENEQFCGFAPYKFDVTNLLKTEKTLLLELSLTRRNTFGPLHQLPILAGGYSSGSYKTQGNEFTESYALVKSGLRTANLEVTI